MKDYKIYDLKWLAENEVEDDDNLYYLFETPSLLYSCVIEEFKTAGYKMSNKEILDICKNDSRWMYKYYWTDKQRKKFEKKLKKAYMRLYRYKEETAEHKIQWFIFLYGLTNKNVEGKENYTFED